MRVDADMYRTRKKKDIQKNMDARLDAWPGIVMGLAFARYTTARWHDGQPSHVWDATTEYAYALVALGLLWTRDPVATRIMIVACGTYHLCLGLVKSRR
jgi:hypothetical protein